MSNSLSAYPIVIDTDITTFLGAAAVTSTNCTQGCGIRVKKLKLVNGSAPITGAVTITAPSDGSSLYPPILVPATPVANAVVVDDNPTDVYGDLTWRDFAVTGVTATGTKLYLWYSV